MGYDQARDVWRSGPPLTCFDCVEPIDEEPAVWMEDMGGDKWPFHATCAKVAGGPWLPCTAPTVEYVTVPGALPWSTADVE